MNFKLWRNTEAFNFCILGCCRLAAEAKKKAYMHRETSRLFGNKNVRAFILKHEDTSSFVHYDGRNGGTTFTMRTNHNTFLSICCASCLLLS